MQTLNYFSPEQADANSIQAVLTNFLPGKNYVTACFTGPRPKNLFGYDSREPYQEIVNATGEVLALLSGLGVRKFISGGAQGFDQMAFWAVNNLQSAGHDVQNILYIPFRNQPSRWRAAGMFGQDEYRLMFQYANLALTLKPDPENYGETVAALHARNHSMVADSDIVIALLADRSLDWQNAKGGTAECVRYAHSQGRPILAIELRPDRPLSAGRYQLSWILP